jgi:ribosome maturation factor RimP
MGVKEAVMPGGSRHVPARPGRAAGRSPARKQGKAPSGRSSATPGSAAADSATTGAGVAAREAAAPDSSAITRVAEPVVHALGMDLESVKVTTAGRRRLLRVVVDSDRGVSLDDAALASRELSAKLDAADVMGDMPYTLEVSSPGVDRPLTQPRHWQRAVGRLVRVPLTPSGAGHARTPAAPGKFAPGKAGSVQGRVVAADAAEVTLDIDGQHRRFGYATLGAGAVQIEFGRPEEPAREDAPDRREPESRGPGGQPDGH